MSMRKPLASEEPPEEEEWPSYPTVLLGVR